MNIAQSKPMKHIILNVDELEKLRKFAPTKNGMVENRLGDYFYDTDILALIANSPQSDDVRKDAERVCFICNLKILDGHKFGNRDGKEAHGLCLALTRQP